MTDLEKIRAGALGRIEGDRRKLIGMLAIVAVLEAGFLGAYVLLMDFHNREHWLLLIAAGLVYTTLGVGLITLGMQQNASARRVLKALEVLRGDA